MSFRLDLRCGASERDLYHIESAKRIYRMYRQVHISILRSKNIDRIHKEGNVVYFAVQNAYKAVQAGTQKVQTSTQKAQTSTQKVQTSTQRVQSSTPIHSNPIHSIPIHSNPIHIHSFSLREINTGAEPGVCLRGGELLFIVLGRGYLFSQRCAIMKTTKPFSQEELL